MEHIQKLLPNEWSERNGPVRRASALLRELQVCSSLAELTLCAFIVRPMHIPPLCMSACCIYAGRLVKCDNKATYAEGTLPGRLFRKMCNVHSH
jgi:hypothetical protein